MASIKDAKQLFHFTALDNIPSILTNGLLARKQLDGFTDVADKEILNGRDQYGLTSMVPFHFFANNPFDGRVCINHPDKKFVFIAIHRNHAKANEWKISPTHPLNGEFNLLPYDDGMKNINWDVMEKKDFKDPASKNICMAECLSPTTVKPQDIFAIYVSNEEDRVSITKLKTELKLRIFVDTKPFMFPNKHNAGK